MAHTLSWYLMALLVDASQKGFSPGLNWLVGMLVHRGQPPMFWITLSCAARPETERWCQSVDRVTSLGEGCAWLGHTHLFGRSRLWANTASTIKAVAGFACFEGHLILGPRTILWRPRFQLTGHTGPWSQKALDRPVACRHEGGGALVLFTALQCCRSASPSFNAASSLVSTFHIGAAVLLGLSPSTLRQHGEYTFALIWRSGTALLRATLLLRDVGILDSTVLFGVTVPTLFATLRGAATLSDALTGFIILLCLALILRTLVSSRLVYQSKHSGGRAPVAAVYVRWGSGFIFLSRRLQVPADSKLHVRNAASTRAAGQLFFHLLVLLCLDSCLGAIHSQFAALRWARWSVTFVSHCRHPWGSDVETLPRMWHTLCLQGAVECVVHCVWQWRVLQILSMQLLRDLEVRGQAGKRRPDVWWRRWSVWFCGRKRLRSMRFGKWWGWGMWVVDRRGGSAGFVVNRIVARYSCQLRRSSSMWSRRSRRSGTIDVRLHALVMVILPQ